MAVTSEHGPPVEGHPGLVGNLDEIAETHDRRLRQLRPARPGTPVGGVQQLRLLVEDQHERPAARNDAQRFVGGVEHECLRHRRPVLSYRPGGRRWAAAGSAPSSPGGAPAHGPTLPRPRPHPATPFEVGDEIVRNPAVRRRRTWSGSGNGRSRPAETGSAASAATSPAAPGGPALGHRPGRARRPARSGRHRPGHRAGPRTPPDRSSLAAAGRRAPPSDRRRRRSADRPAQPAADDAAVGARTASGPGPRARLGPRRRTAPRSRAPPIR